MNIQIPPRGIAGSGLTRPTLWSESENKMDYGTENDRDITAKAIDTRKPSRLAIEKLDVALAQLLAEIEVLGASLTPILLPAESQQPEDFSSNEDAQPDYQSVLTEQLIVFTDRLQNMTRYVHRLETRVDL